MHNKFHHKLMEHPIKDRAMGVVAIEKLQDAYHLPLAPCNLIQ